MIELADEKQAGAIDRRTIEQYQLPSMVLMERAALAFCEVLWEREKKDTPILIVCGNGNNGGDGLAAGRILAQKGYPVTLLCAGNSETGTEQFCQQREILRQMKLPVLSFSKEEAQEKKEQLKTVLASAKVIVDALFGVGLNREISGHYKELITCMNEAEAVKYAMDIPSGIHAGSAQVLGTAFRADVTVTFGIGKKGLYLYPGADYAGEVFIKDIGFLREAVRQEKLCWKMLEESDLYGILKRKRHSHKGTYGRVLVIAGSRTMSGAAYFSAMAAYRMGAGLVKIVSEVHNEGVLRTLLPEALFSFYEEGEEPKELLQKELQWADAVVTGPGLSLSDTAAFIVRQVLTGCSVPCVVDADAITLLAGFSKQEKEQYLKKENLVLTPHLKELAVLLQKETAEVSENLSRVTELLPAFGGVLVCKDAVTLTAGADTVYVNTIGTNGLATGGSGDILTGILAGIYAQRRQDWKKELLYDTARGVTLHGLCGRYAAKCCSESSMLARDTLDSICAVLKKITDCE